MLIDNPTIKPRVAAYAGLNVESGTTVRSRDSNMSENDKGVAPSPCLILPPALRFVILDTTPGISRELPSTSLFGDVEQSRGTIRERLLVATRGHRRRVRRLRVPRGRVGRHRLQLALG